MSPGASIGRAARNAEHDHGPDRRWAAAASRAVRCNAEVCATVAGGARHQRLSGAASGSPRSTNRAATSRQTSGSKPFRASSAYARARRWRGSATRARDRRLRSRRRSAASRSGSAPSAPRRRSSEDRRRSWRGRCPSSGAPRGSPAPRAAVPDRATPPRPARMPRRRGSRAPAADRWHRPRGRAGSPRRGAGVGPRPLSAGAPRGSAPRHRGRPVDRRPPPVARAAPLGSRRDAWR